MNNMPIVTTCLILMVCGAVAWGMATKPRGKGLPFRLIACLGFGLSLYAAFYLGSLASPDHWLFGILRWLSDLIGSGEPQAVVV